MKLKILILILMIFAAGLQHAQKQILLNLLILQLLNRTLSQVNIQ